VFVMEIHGHSQISVTMNTYSHVKPASSREPVVGGGLAFSSLTGACVPALLIIILVCELGRPAWASSGSTLAVPASWLVVGSTR
jgi:hypothetical protein